MNGLDYRPAVLVQIAKPSQPPMNVYDCEVAISANGRVDIRCGTRFDFPNVQATEITTALERCIIAWKA